LWLLLLSNKCCFFFFFFFSRFPALLNKHYLHSGIKEAPIPEVCETFKVARGMVQSLQENAGRFASVVLWNTWMPWSRGPGCEVPKLCFIWSEQRLWSWLILHMLRKLIPQHKVIIVVILLMFQSSWLILQR
jgi:hypothetical protein